jgi:protein-disulfide isomerase
MVVDGKSDFPNDVLKQYAADLELDTEEFATCLDEGKYADLVREQTQLSSYLGVSGTPTFIINGKGLVGAQPFEVFEQVIEQEREQ